MTGSRQPAAAAHVEETRHRPLVRRADPRQGAAPSSRSLGAVNPTGAGVRIHDRLGDPAAAAVVGTLAQMRRQKDPDEIAFMGECMRATDAGHA